MSQGAITSKIKHAIKLKTSPARLAQLLQRSLAFCFSLQSMTAYRLVLKQNANEGCNSCATVVQVLQDLFYVLLHVLFYLWSLLQSKGHTWLEARPVRSRLAWLRNRLRVAISLTLNIFNAIRPYPSYVRDGHFPLDRFYPPAIPLRNDHPDIFPAFWRT